MGLFLLFASRVQALGPHELLVLVNKNSCSSKEVANAFIQERGIPPENVVYLDLPDSILEPGAAISPADFTRLIWEPANAVMQRRGIGNHILAWIYSVDFPIRVTTTPLMSVQGLTFVRNQIPAAEMIQKGLYQSPLFAGPDFPDHAGAPAHSLEGFFARYQTGMPLPSMMLGFTGARGNDVEMVLRILRRGALSDHTSPPGSIFFQVSDDIRSKCRAWQYAGAQKELEALRVASMITSEVPDVSTKIMGLMSGRPWIDTTPMRNALPGCMAEHLTSFSAVFDNSDQSKATQWLGAGASLTAGIVTEPMAIWTKFPHARFFVHYAAGCTALESFYQAIRCPLQILLLGDPLAAPWAPNQSMVLVQLEEGAVSNKATFHAQLFSTISAPVTDYMYLLDGRSLQGPSLPDIELNVKELADGYHELRAVAYQQGGIRHQAFATAGFIVDRKGRNVRLEGISRDTQIDVFHPISLQISAAGKPETVGVMCGSLEIASATAVQEGSLKLSIDPLELGPGPNKIQAFAKYADGDYVRGEPVLLKVDRLDKAPVIEGVDMSTNQEGQIILTPEIVDAENDPVEVHWLQALPSVQAVKGGLEMSKGAIRVVPSTNGLGIVVLPSANDHVQEISSRMHSVGCAPNFRGQYGGILFHFLDSKNFIFFGFRGDVSAWSLGVFRNGVWEWKMGRGAIFVPDHDYALSVCQTGKGVVECRMDDELLFSLPDDNSGLGRTGLLSAAVPTDFAAAAIGLSTSSNDFKMVGSKLAISPGCANGQTLFLQVSDGHRSSLKQVTLSAK